MEAAPASQAPPAHSSVDPMQTDQPVANGIAQPDVNPTPPEDNVPQGGDIVKPGTEAIAAAPDSISTGAPDPQPAIQEPTEHVESGISGVADFLPSDVKSDQLIPSPSEPPALASAEPQDTIMSDAPPTASTDAAPPAEETVVEPVQQHTPAPEVNDPMTNGEGVSEDANVKAQSELQPEAAEQAAAPAEVVPVQAGTSQSASTLPSTSSDAPITTPPATAEETSVPKLETQSSDTQMAESTASLTRPRDEEDASDEPSAKRARRDEPVTEAPIQSAAKDDFKRPEAPATSSEPVAQPASTTNGTATRHLPPRSSYSTESLTKLQKKTLEEKIKNTKKVKSAIPFLRPVDYMAMNIPNYPNIIKQPMDLSTMEQKLKADQYASLEAFVNDFELMVNNCFTFNGPAHAVSVQAQTLRAYFLKQMDGVPIGEAAAAMQKPKKEAPVVKPPPRRESRAAAVPAPPVSTAVPPAPPAATPGSARSPGASDTFALLPGGTPQIRRDSTAGRPKRAVVPPAPRDLPYSASKPKRKENQVGLKFCQHVLDELRKPRYDHMTIYFREPVDPVALNIPHYFQIIKKPMDMQTVTNKLKNGQYGSAEEFKSDFDLIFHNCFKFNPADNGVHQTGKTLQGEFEALWKTKNEWVKKHQPRSQRVSPASDNESDAGESSGEDEEEEDEKEATIRALKEQLESMQNMLGQISGGAKRDSPKASSKKKSRSSGGVTKSKKSSASVPAKPAAKPKANKKLRLVSYEEKQEISTATESMNEAQIQQLTDIITQNEAKYRDMAGDSLELDLDDLSNDVQHKLLKYVRTIFPKAKPTYAEDEDFGVDDDYEPERGSKSGGARKKHKPMKKKEQEDRIAQLNAKVQAMKQGITGDAAPAAAQYDSSGDEDSESSEEE
ncbi:Bromodomain-containing protein [Elsinoe fawcettii]|nr:Bromodomain-containing protein [Elsinoe fawcettii]